MEDNFDMAAGRTTSCVRGEASARLQSELVMGETVGEMGAPLLERMMEGVSEEMERGGFEGGFIESARGLMNSAAVLLLGSAWWSMV